MPEITPEGFSYSDPEPAFSPDLLDSTNNFSYPGGSAEVPAPPPFNIYPAFRRTLRVITTE